MSEARASSSIISSKVTLPLLVEPWIELGEGARLLAVVDALFDAALCFFDTLTVLVIDPSEAVLFFVLVSVACLLAFCLGGMRNSMRYENSIIGVNIADQSIYISAGRRVWGSRVRHYQGPTRTRTLRVWV